MKKVGIIGFGRIGRIHFNTINTKLEGVEVVAVADSFADKMTDVFKKYGVVNFSSDYNDIINNKEIDTIFVCSPTDTHAQVAIAAARAGKNIFCEKPIDFDIKLV